MPLRRAYAEALRLPMKGEELGLDGPLSLLKTCYRSAEWLDFEDMRNSRERLLKNYELCGADERVSLLLFLQKSGCEWAGELAGAAAVEPAEELRIVLRAMKEAEKEGCLREEDGVRSLGWGALLLVQCLVRDGVKSKDVEEALEAVDRDIELPLKGAGVKREERVQMTGWLMHLLAGKKNAREIRFLHPTIPGRQYECTRAVGKEERAKIGLDASEKLVCQVWGEGGAVLSAFVGATTAEIAVILSSLQGRGCMETVTALSLCPAVLFHLVSRGTVFGTIEVLRLCDSEETVETALSPGLPLDYILECAFLLFPRLRTVIFENWKGCGCGRVLVDASRPVGMGWGLAIPRDLETIRFPKMACSESSRERILAALEKMEDRKRANAMRGAFFNAQ